MAYASLAVIYRIFMLFSSSIFVAAHYFVVGALIAIWGITLGLGMLSTRVLNTS